MPQELISQFDRKFNNPIETNRAVGTITQRDSISSLTRWEGMIVYVESNDTSYVLKGGTDNTAWAALVGIDEAPIDGMQYNRKDEGWVLAYTQEYSSYDKSYAVTISGSASPAPTSHTTTATVNVKEYVDRYIVKGTLQLSYATLTGLNFNKFILSIITDLDWEYFPNDTVPGTYFDTSIIGNLNIIAGTSKILSLQGTFMVQDDRASSSDVYVQFNRTMYKF
ncbi:structural protein [Cellulophaga phage phi12:1]|uniref:Structural protein n=2 Tax=Cellulophaga phage phi12:1 TaxID=1327976 RepID=R9ZZR9_9CAUD|nr:virion structural protein [Cellulophaga phage phi12:1]AGO48025.1 structural protein [Cellulophaga phage phi12:1]AGO48190.1 structural protein [Cellulophaga phage phi12:3]